MNKKPDWEVTIIDVADAKYQRFVAAHTRYSVTVNAGFPDKADDPAKVIDDAIYRGLCIAAGTALVYLRLVSVTTTVLKVSYGEMVLVTVIAEPLPKQEEGKP